MGILSIVLIVIWASMILTGIYGLVKGYFYGEQDKVKKHEPNAYRKWIKLSSVFVILCGVINVVWIIWSVCMIILSIFPGIITLIGELIGILVPVNTVYLLLIFLLYCMTFYLFLKISKHNEEIIKLNYEIANLKKEISKKKLRRIIKLVIA